MDEDLPREADSEVTSDQCVIRGVEFYVRGPGQIPVRNDDRVFEWGVWVSLSRDSFMRTADLWEVAGAGERTPDVRLAEHRPADYTPSPVDCRGWCTPVRSDSARSWRLEATAHPLAREQKDGISVAELEQRAARLLHGS